MRKLEHREIISQIIWLLMESKGDINFKTKEPAKMLFGINHILEEIRKRFVNCALNSATMTDLIGEIKDKTGEIGTSLNEISNELEYFHTNCIRVLDVLATGRPIVDNDIISLMFVVAKINKKKISFSCNYHISNCGQNFVRDGRLDFREERDNIELIVANYNRLFEEFSDDLKEIIIISVDDTNNIFYEIVREEIITKTEEIVEHKILNSGQLK